MSDLLKGAEYAQNPATVPYGIERTPGFKTQSLIVYRQRQTLGRAITRISDGKNCVLEKKFKNHERNVAREKATTQPL
ncbi:hypothetical protein [Pseudomonas sp. IT-P44]|uniref:hypothetical protein n=1 Tax=Pseudomonas sp. IT-P44 TaxID=3026451 RepID=UPI0039DF4EF2